MSYGVYIIVFDPINNDGFIRAFYLTFIGEKCQLHSSNLFLSKHIGGGSGGFCPQKLGGKVQTARQNDAICSLESKEELMGSN